MKILDDKKHFMISHSFTVQCSHENFFISLFVAIIIIVSLLVHMHSHMSWVTIQTNLIWNKNFEELELQKINYTNISQKGWDTRNSYCSPVIQIPNNRKEL